MSESKAIGSLDPSILANLPPDSLEWLFHADRLPKDSVLKYKQEVLKQNQGAFVRYGNEADNAINRLTELRWLLRDTEKSMDLIRAEIAQYNNSSFNSESELVKRINITTSPMQMDPSLKLVHIDTDREADYVRAYYLLDGFKVANPDDQDCYHFIPAILIRVQTTWDNSGIFEFQAKPLLHENSHPHISGGKICLGEIQDWYNLNKSNLNVDTIQDAWLMIKGILQVYNLESPFRDFESNILASLKAYHEKVKKVVMNGRRVTTDLDEEQKLMLFKVFRETLANNFDVGLSRWSGRGQLPSGFDAFSEEKAWDLFVKTVNYWHEKFDENEIDDKITESWHDEGLSGLESWASDLMIDDPSYSEDEEDSEESAWDDFKWNANKRLEDLENLIEACIHFIENDGHQKVFAPTPLEVIASEEETEVFGDDGPVYEVSSDDIPF